MANYFKPLYGIGKEASCVVKSVDDIADATSIADEALDGVSGASKGKGIHNPEVKRAIDYGNQMHREWDYGEGVETEYYLKESRGRVDGLDLVKRHIYELKPNNAKAIKAGEKQAARYVEELNRTHPGDKDWTWEILTYDRPF